MLAVSAAIVLGLVSTGGPAQATYPGRNGLIAFGLDVGNGFQIYTMRSNGHELRQVTDVEGDAVVPDWSLDGHRIVFEFDHPYPGGCSIDLINADGSGMIDLTGQRTGCEQNPSFTPDGRRIVFVAQRCGRCVSAIWSMDLGGHHRHLIAAAPTGLGAIDPNVSPDGATLSFVAETASEQRALYLVNMDGSHLRQIVPFSYDLGTRYDWAPDGERLVFTTQGFGTSNLATVRPDGSDVRSLTFSRTPDVTFGGGAFSPDGRWIVFREVDHGVPAWYRIRPDGGELHEIVAMPDAVQNPGGVDWGPAAS
jgi:Tol biopolymer transport system component